MQSGDYRKWHGVNPPAGGLNVIHEKIFIPFQKQFCMLIENGIEFDEKYLL